LIDRDLNLGQFDLVISSDVIEHLYRPSDLLEAAISTLNPAVTVLLGTPYHGYLKNLVLAATGKMDAHFSALHDGGHIKFFSVSTLSQLMRAHGFDDLSFTFYGRAPWLWKNMICHARKRLTRADNRGLLNAGPDHATDTHVQRSAEHRALRSAAELGPRDRRRRQFQRRRHRRDREVVSKRARVQRAFDCHRNQWEFGLKETEFRRPGCSRLMRIMSSR
jgi:hypothetical protein